MVVPNYCTSYSIHCEIHSAYNSDNKMYFQSLKNRKEPIVKNPNKRSQLKKIQFNSILLSLYIARAIVIEGWVEAFLPCLAHCSPLPFSLPSAPPSYLSWIIQFSFLQGADLPPLHSSSCPAAPMFPLWLLLCYSWTKWWTSECSYKMYFYLNTKRPPNEMTALFLLLGIYS